jgi:hypothetical protein
MSGQADALYSTSRSPGIHCRRYPRRPPPHPRPLAGARGFDWDYSEYVIIRPLPTRSIAVGGGLRDVLDPSAQVGQYETYLEDGHTAFDPDSGIRLNACSYLHNYSYESSDVLFADRFRSLPESFPLFTGDDVDKLIKFLRLHIANCVVRMSPVVEASWRVFPKSLPL